MAYSNIYYTLDNVVFTNQRFIAARPNVQTNYESVKRLNESVKRARKENRPVMSYGISVAFPDNYEIDGDIELSNIDANGRERFGLYKFPHNVHYDAVILILKDLMVSVPVAVKRGFMQDLIKSCMINQTHTISLCMGTVMVSGKFKFNKQFLELVEV